MTRQAARPDLGDYRRFVVAFSGGKDSLAALLHLISLGVPAHASTSSSDERAENVGLLNIYRRTVLPRPLRGHKR